MPTPTALSAPDFLTKWTARFADNSFEKIDEATFRELIGDIDASFANRADVPLLQVALSLSAAQALIAARKVLPLFYALDFGADTASHPQTVYVRGLGPAAFDTHGSLAVNGQVSQVSVNVAAGTFLWLGMGNPNARPDLAKSVIYLTHAAAVAAGYPDYASLDQLDPAGLALGTVARVDLHPDAYGQRLELVYDDRADPFEAGKIRGYIDGNFAKYSVTPDGLGPLKWVKFGSVEAAAARIRRYAAGIADWAADETMKILLAGQDHFFSAVAAGGPFAPPDDAATATADWTPAAAPVAGGDGGAGLRELVLPQAVVGGAWYVTPAGIWEARRSFNAAAAPAPGPNWRPVVSFASSFVGLTGDPNDNFALAQALAAKQDRPTAPGRQSWHVEDLGQSASGEGSPYAPFRTFAQAHAAAGDGDVIYYRPVGTYNASTKRYEHTEDISVTKNLTVVCVNPTVVMMGSVSSGRYPASDTATNAVLIGFSIGARCVALKQSVSSRVAFRGCRVVPGGYFECYGIGTAGPADAVSIEDCQADTVGNPRALVYMNQRSDGTQAATVRLVGGRLRPGGALADGSLSGGYGPDPASRVILSANVLLEMQAGVALSSAPALIVDERAAAGGPGGPGYTNDQALAAVFPYLFPLIGAEAPVTATGSVTLGGGLAVVFNFAAAGGSCQVTVNPAAADRPTARVVALRCDPASAPVTVNMTGTIDGAASLVLQPGTFRVISSLVGDTQNRFVTIFQTGGPAATSAGIDYTAEIVHTAAAALAPGDCFRSHVLSGAVPFALTLPAAAACTGKQIAVRVRTTATAIFSIAAASGETINNDASFPLWAEESLLLFSTGTAWVKVSNRLRAMRADITLTPGQVIQMRQLGYLYSDRLPLTYALKANTPQMHDAVNGVVRIQRSGRYLVNVRGRVDFSTLNTTLDVVVFVNQAISQDFLTSPTVPRPDDLAALVTGTAILDLAAGGEITFCLYSSNSGGPVYNNRNASPSHIASLSVTELT